MLIKKSLTKILPYAPIEVGTSGDWTYKKYADGTLEAEAIVNSGQITIGTVYSGNFWRSNSDISVPTYASAPKAISGTVEKTFMGSTTGNAFLVQSNGALWLMRAQSASTALQDCTFHLRLINGRWK